MTNYAGTDSFTFSRVNDGLVDSPEATVNLLVKALNQAPVLAGIGNQTIASGTALSFKAVATDVDIPAQTLTFSLDPGAPPGASITTNGLFRWTPTAAQAPTTNPITVRVTDNGSPKHSDTKTFTVTVVPPGSIIRMLHARS